MLKVAGKGRKWGNWEIRVLERSEKTMEDEWMTMILEREKGGKILRKTKRG